MLYISLIHLKKVNIEFKTKEVMSHRAVNRFVNLKARVDDTSDQEEEGEDHSDSAPFSILIYGMVFLHIRMPSQGFP